MGEREPAPLYHVLPWGAKDRYGREARGYPVQRRAEGLHIADFCFESDARAFCHFKNLLTEIHGTDALPLQERRR